MVTKKETKKKRVVKKLSVPPECVLTVCEGPDGVLTVRGTKCPPGYMKQVRDKVKAKGIRFLEEE